MKLPSIIFGIALGICLLFGGQWYLYVTNTESSYDEVGIAINSRMPGPLRKWGCDRLQATFLNALPPYGCQNPADATRWI